MARDHARNQGEDLAELVGLVVRDAEQLLGQHLRLVSSEFRRGLQEIPPAMVSMAAGAGLLATGGVLGSLMLVHGLNRSTRLPLWGCYGVVGGMMATLGAGLLTAGSSRAAQVRLVPIETLTALREDAQWIKDQVSRPPT